MSTVTEILPYRPDVIAETLGHSHRFFRRSTCVLSDEHADFAPQEGLLTVKEHVAHVAHTVDWFLDALESGEYDMEFERHAEEISAVESLTAAFDWVDRAFDRAGRYLANRTAEELAQLQPENPIMNGPKGSVFAAVIEHTAHHRGALTVYSRLQGLVPPMPYLEEGEELG
ncbi:MAG: DinB family protein [Thermoanaerobaculia bacterium]|nr:DinB family protein [Thermoanaerobaculia bacterium]